MPHARSLLACLGVCLLAAAPPHADAQGADARTRDVYVSAVDSRGAPVPGLTAADFVVREDGAAREVLNVRQADAPMHVALLIDDSQAAADSTLYLREGLAAFLERLRGRAQVALITMGDRPTVMAPYTADFEDLQKRVSRIFPRPGAGAYLLDAVYDASRGLARRQAERRVIVALTFEGADFSNRQHQQVLQELEASGASLHVLAIGTPSPSLSDEMRNRSILIGDGTTRTGGRQDQVLSNMGIPERLKLAADELVHQYVLTYARPEKLVRPEKLSVTSTRPNVTVRAPTRLPAR